MSQPQRVKPPPLRSAPSGYRRPPQVSFTSTMRSNHPIMGPSYTPMDHAHPHRAGPKSAGLPGYANNCSQHTPSVSVSVVPYVVPALTPAASSAVAAVKPSHQVLIMRPLPAYLTEDDDLLALAKQFVFTAVASETEAVEAQRILRNGDEALLSRIGAIKNTFVSTVPTKNDKMSAHCNYLPFSAKVVRNSVLSAVTTALQRQQRTQTAAELEGALQVAVAEAEVMPSTKCFCEEGYGFLLFATEEAGLTYLRAAERLSRSKALSQKSFGLRPSNVNAVRRDYDEIDRIKRSIYAGSSADSESVLNASFTSSVSSSSCDSASSFDSQSSDDEEAQQKSHSCTACTTKRRSYRTYYRAKMNKRIEEVKIRCNIISEAASVSSEGTRCMTTFNGLPLPTKEQVAEMRSLFANCFFNTTLSVAGADSTVAAKPRPKIAIQSKAQQRKAKAAAATAPATLMIHRPVIIDSTDAAHPTISFMRSVPGKADHLPTSSLMSLLPTKEADVVNVTKKEYKSGLHHHTHHRHCTEHRPIAVTKRSERRKTRALQAKLQPRAMHIVNLAVPVQHTAPPPAYATQTIAEDQNTLATTPFFGEMDCPSPYASNATAVPPSSASDSAGDVSHLYDRSAPPLPPTAAMTPAGHGRFRHNPYSSGTQPPARPASTVVPAQSESTTAYHQPAPLHFVSDAPEVAISAGIAQQPQQAYQTGLASYLPYWAQQTGTGIQGAAGNASARLMEMLTMGNVRRF